MRMHRQFVRTIGGSGIVLGSEGAIDAPPTGAPSQSQDNVLFASHISNAGNPVKRVAVSYRGPALAPNLDAQLWLWDDVTEAWYALTGAVSMAANRIALFDVVALSDPFQGGGEVKSTAGSLAAILIVQTTGGAPAGEYVFSMGPDLAGV